MKERLKIGASSRFHTEGRNGRFSPLEMVEHFHRVGFEGIDFDIETVPDMGEDWQRTLGAVAELAAKYGIQMDYGHLPFHQVLGSDGKADPEAFSERMLHCIEAAGFAGIKNAVIHPLKAKNGEDGFQKNVEYMTPFAEKAEKCGVKLAIENMRSPREAEGIHRYGSTADEIIKLADYFGVGNCWDFGHAHTTGLVQSTEIARLGSRLTVLHVNDNHAGDDLHLLPFFGTINWEDAMLGLKATGFSGVFNFECRMVRLPTDAGTRDGAAAYALGVGRYLTGLLLDQ